MIKARTHAEIAGTLPRRRLLNERTQAGENGAEAPGSVREPREPARTPSAAGEDRDGRLMPSPRLNRPVNRTPDGADFRRARRSGSSVVEQPAQPAAVEPATPRSSLGAGPGLVAAPQPAAETRAEEPAAPRAVEEEVITKDDGSGETKAACWRSPDGYGFSVRPTITTSIPRTTSMSPVADQTLRTQARRHGQRRDPSAERR